MSINSDIAETQERNVLVFHGSEQAICRLSWTRFHDRTYRIELTGSEVGIDAVADDLFAALQQIRRTLEGRGWFIAVQGARTDAYPSGMLRDTVGAYRVYVLHLGKDMERNDMVDIFAEAAADLLGTVDQQNEFYREWRTSVAR